MISTNDGHGPVAQVCGHACRSPLKKTPLTAHDPISVRREVSGEIAHGHHRDVRRRLAATRHSNDDQSSDADLHTMIKIPSGAAEVSGALPFWTKIGISEIGERRPRLAGYFPISPFSWNLWVPVCMAAHECRTGPFRRFRDSR